jgi:hypothetical protein
MRLMQATLKIMPEEPVKDVDALAQRLADEQLKDRKGGEQSRLAGIERMMGIAPAQDCNNHRAVLAQGV